jgi:hypothetical protein
MKEDEIGGELSAHEEMREVYAVLSGEPEGADHS